ncbi:MAG: hypothetical protein HY796_02530 [Elusimicrobia bacterium]|nr:hypothetical protein [Elusimicrobiota bacterium]
MKIKWPSPHIFVFPIITWLTGILGWVFFFYLAEAYGRIVDVFLPRQRGIGPTWITVFSFTIIGGLTGLFVGLIDRRNWLTAISITMVPILLLLGLIATSGSDAAPSWRLFMCADVVILGISAYTAAFITARCIRKQKGGDKGSC